MYAMYQKKRKTAGMKEVVGNGVFLKKTLSGDSSAHGLKS